MKKGCSVFIAICLSASLFTTVFASPNSGEDLSAESVGTLSSYDMEKELVKLTILAFGEVEATPTEAYALMDTAGNKTIVCVEFVGADEKSGFALVDLTDYTVTMYALDAAVPFESDDNIICDGLLGFAVINETGSTATVLGTNETVPTAALYNNGRAGLSIATETQKNEILRAVQERCAANAQARSSELSAALVAGGNDTTLVYSAGNNDGDWTTDCSVNAVAMYLRHMDKYFNSTYVHASHQTEPTLKSALAAIALNNWKTTVGLTTSRLATLTNDYLSMYGASGASEVSCVSYTWSTFVSQINYGNGKPCILSIAGGETSYWSSRHAVIGVGYTAGATESSGYIIVNSGWISLGYVHISTDAPDLMVK